MKILGALFILLSFSACRQTIEANGLKIELDAQKLSNGLSVIMIEDHTVPLVTYQTWYRVGSVDDDTGKTGLAHLFERLMFKGTAKISSQEFFSRIEAKGGLVRAHSTRDYVTYQTTAPTSLLDTIIELESDRMNGIKLTPELLQSEILLGLEERKLQSDSIQSRVNESLWGLAYRRHPYRWPVMGYPQDLMSITPENVQEFQKKYFSPSNATLVIVGDFSSDALFEKIKKSYGLIAKRDRPKREIQAEKEQDEERRLMIHEQTVSERFSYAYHIPQAGDADTHALDVLSNILFEGQYSRFQKEIAQADSPLLDVQGTAFTPTFAGLFLFQGILKKGISAEKGEDRVAAIIKQIQENGVSQDEVRRATQQLSFDMLKGLKTAQGVGQLVGTVMMVFDDPSKFEQDVQKYSKVSVDDVKKVATKYFYPNNRSVVILRSAERGGL